MTRLMLCIALCSCLDNPVPADMTPDPCSTPYPGYSAGVITIDHKQYAAMDLVTYNNLTAWIADARACLGAP